MHGESGRQHASTPCSLLLHPPCAHAPSALHRAPAGMTKQCTQRPADAPTLRACSLSAANGASRSARTLLPVCRGRKVDCRACDAALSCSGTHRGSGASWPARTLLPVCIARSTELISNPGQAAAPTHPTCEQGDSRACHDSAAGRGRASTHAVWSNLGPYSHSVQPYQIDEHSPPTSPAR